MDRQSNHCYVWTSSQRQVLKRSHTEPWVPTVPVKENPTTSKAVAVIFEPNLPQYFDLCTLELVCYLDEMNYAAYQVAICLEQGPGGEEKEIETIRTLPWRARLFEFIHRHVFYSDHLMLRSTTQSSREALHTGERSHVDAKLCCFPRACSTQIEHLHNGLSEHLPLGSVFEGDREFEAMIKQQLALLFDAALRCRGRLSLSSAVRYELVRFEAGDIFMDAFMEVTASKEVSRKPAANRVQRIRLCVHGCLVALVPANSPLLASEKGKAGCHARFPEQLRGILLSDKAIVVL